MRDRNEHAAMRAHEVARELFLELFQRLVEQILAARMPHGDVFLVRFEVANVLHRNQLQLVAHAHGHVLPRRQRLLGRAQPMQLRSAETRRVLQCFLEPLATHRLQQVAHGLRFECLERVLVVRRREHDRRRVLERAEMACDFDACHSRHADVEQHDGRVQLARPARAHPSRSRTRRPRRSPAAR